MTVHLQLANVVESGVAVQPALWIAHSNIASVEFARVGGGSSTFDMYVHTRDSQLLEFRNLSRCCRLHLQHTAVS